MDFLSNHQHFHPLFSKKIHPPTELFVKPTVTSPTPPSSSSFFFSFSFSFSASSLFPPPPHLSLPAPSHVFYFTKKTQPFLDHRFRRFHSKFAVSKKKIEQIRFSSSLSSGLFSHTDSFDYTDWRAASDSFGNSGMGLWLRRTKGSAGTPSV